MQRILNSAWKMVIVAAGYVLASLLGTWLLGGRPGWAGVGLSLVGGLLMGATLGPIAARLPESRLRHVLIWGSVLFLNPLSTSIEGIFYQPTNNPVATMPAAWAARLLMEALVSAILITWLFAPEKGAADGDQVRQRPWYSWAWRFVLSAFSYLLFYFIFGALNFALVTGPYYRAHAGGLAVPAAQTVLMAESVRAPLIILSIVPLILAWKAKKSVLAVLCGTILFVIGGVIPLLLSPTLPDLLRLASAVEIFFQNFPAGVVAAVLLGFGPVSDRKGG